MHPATEAILTFNHGRDPERLTRKLDAMAREPFSFFRGSNHLYAASVQHEEALLDARTLMSAVTCTGELRQLQGRQRRCTST